MELILNVAWLLVAGTVVCLWLRRAAPNEPDRRRELVAILVLVAVLFPAISVSDDLLAIQNAYEADNFLRRDHLVSPGLHPIQPAIALMAAFVFAGPGFGFLRLAAPRVLPVRGLDHPGLSCIDNRPPPVA